MKLTKKLLLSTAVAVSFNMMGTMTKAEQVVRIAAPFEIKGADPALSGDIFLRMEVVEPLVEVNKQGDFIPALAKSWKVSADGKRWEFVLRDNVTFHDGSALTAESVVKSLNTARSKPGLLDKVPVKEVSGKGNVVTIILSEPFAPLLSVLAESRSQILALASWNKSGQITQIIGTGPFRVTHFQAPQSLHVERYDGYWGVKPAITSAHYLSAGRAETRSLLAESGDADYVFNLDPASRTRLAHKKNLNVMSVDVPRTVLLKLNTGHPFLRDVNTRKAISMAIDRQTLTQSVLRYPGAATQMFPPNMGRWHNKALQPLTTNVEQAKTLLREAGWKAGADGILQRDGKPFKLTLITFPDRPELPLIAMVIQQQLQQVGIGITINSTNSSEIPIKHHDNTLEMALFSRNFALTPDPTGTLLQDYAPKGGDWGAMNWTNPTFQTALNTLAHTTDEKQVQQARDVVTAQLQSDLPVIPITWYQQSAAVTKRLKNVELDAFERHFGLRDMAWDK